MLEQAAALLETTSSTNPQLLPCPGGCRPGLGHTGSAVGHAGLSPSRGPWGPGRPGGTAATCPAQGPRRPQSHTLL